MTGRWSISLRLTVWFGSIFFLGWLLFGVAMWINLNATLTTERDLTLSRRLDRLQEVLRKNQNESEADRRETFQEFASATGNGLNEVFRADGTRVFPSPSQAARSFPWPSLTDVSAEQFWRTVVNGQSYRVAVRPFALKEQQFFLAAASSEASNQHVLNRFLAGLLASAPVLLLISSAGGYLVGRRALRPVDKITTAVQSISIGKLSERLPEANSGDELQRLSETCNAMLSRLESSVVRIRQFTADASHELRAPLSIIRTAAEVAMRNPQLDSQSHRAYQEIVEETAKAAALLDDMLTLARADSDHGDLLWEPVELSGLVQGVCEKAMPIAHERGLTLRMRLDSHREVMVMGDMFALRRLLWTLIDNALKYTSKAGSVVVSLDGNADRAVVEVSDSGIGIAAEELPYIFDRFYRADPSRSRVEGTGLGLAIAKWIALMHKAELTATSEPNKGTTFRILFPMCPAQ